MKDFKKNFQIEKIYAFEPNIIQYNCMLNRKKRLINEWALPEDSIVTINGGLGEVNSIAELSVQSDHLQGTILKPVKRDEIHTDTCKIYTLDSIIDEKVTIIKSEDTGKNHKISLI